MLDISDIGYYRIEEAFISRYDKSGDSFNIANMIASISFTESIYSPVLIGNLFISDTSNIVDNFPIRGEEILTLSYSDFFENKVTQDYIIYGVENMGPNTQQNSIGYLLKFISPQAIMSASRVVQKSYAGTTTDIINKIFAEYLTEQQRFENARYEIETEEAVGVQTIVIPSLSPLRAIDFLKRRSFSADNKSSNYLFFQNRDRFKMVTHEKLIKDSRRERNFDSKKIYTHDPGMVIDSKSADLALNNILEISFPRRQDTINEIQYGGMTSETVEIDVLKKQYQLFPYNYKNEFEKYTHLDQNVKSPHTQAFIDKYFANPDNKVVSDVIFVDVERPNQKYREISAQRRSSSFFLNSIVAKIEIYGRNDLFAGDIIRMNLPQYEVVEGEKELHQSLSGYWMVNEMIHKMEGKEYRMEVTVTKDLPKAGGVD